MSQTPWKPGRGRLGPLKPLLGKWMASGDSPRGTFCCVRQFTTVLNGTYVELMAHWYFGEPAALVTKNGGDTGAVTGSVYEERAYFKADGDGIHYWSFTSDGKNSTGVKTEATDLHESAIAFVAEMPQGQARQGYWPGENGDMKWVVESKTQKGWSRFTDHLYKRIAEPAHTSH